jgi:hypothetical protein
VAEKCEREKKALDEAAKQRDIAEGLFNDREYEIQDWETEARRALGSTGECLKPVWHTGSGGLRWHTEGENTLDEQCVIDKWIYAWKLLDAAERFRSGSVYRDLWARLEAWRTQEEDRKERYCKCLNETPG